MYKLNSKNGLSHRLEPEGVFLPGSSKYKVDDATSHANVHTKLYYDTVFERISMAPPGTVRAELQKIANELSIGTFPY